MKEHTLKGKAFHYANEHGKQNWMALYDAYIAGAREAMSEVYSLLLGGGAEEALNYIDRQREKLR